MHYDHPELAQIAEMELRADERLLWVGKPIPMRIALNNISTSLFGIVFTGVAIFIMSSASNMGAPGFFSLFASLFVLVGLGTIATPGYAYIKATRTVYAITDRRLMIITRMFSQSVASYDDRDIERIERCTRGNNTGDIIFRHEIRTRRTRTSSGHYRTRQYTVPIGFFGIENAREVESTLLDNFMTDES